MHCALRNVMRSVRRSIELVLPFEHVGARHTQREVLHVLRRAVH